MSGLALSTALEKERQRNTDLQREVESLRGERLDMEDELKRKIVSLAKCQSSLKKAKDALESLYPIRRTNVDEALKAIKECGV